VDGIGGTKDVTLIYLKAQGEPGSALSFPVGLMPLFSIRHAGSALGRQAYDCFVTKLSAFHRIADHKITDLAALLPWNWRRAIPLERAA
jgi:hypothetical protein